MALSSGLCQATNPAAHAVTQMSAPSTVQGPSYMGARRPRGPASTRPAGDHSTQHAHMHNRKTRITHGRQASQADSRPGPTSRRDALGAPRTRPFLSTNQQPASQAPSLPQHRVSDCIRQQRTHLSSPATAARRAQHLKRRSGSGAPRARSLGSRTPGLLAACSTRAAPRIAPHSQRQQAGAAATGRPLRLAPHPGAPLWDCRARVRGPAPSALVLSMLPLITSGLDSAMSFHAC